MSFSSDSTYCSLYEDSKQSLKTCSKSMKTHLQMINEEVMQHLLGTKLLDNNDVMKYMREASRLRLNNYKDKYLAEKLKGYLQKIYNVNKKFEESIKSGELMRILDPLKSFQLSQDMEVIPVPKNGQHPIPTLFPANDVNNSASFPLDMLSNQNFETGESKPIEEYNSMDLFSSQKAINCVNLTDSMTTVTLENSELENSLGQNDDIVIENSSTQICSYQETVSDDDVFKKPFLLAKRRKVRNEQSNAKCYSNSGVISESEPTRELELPDDSDSNVAVANFPLVDDKEHDQTGSKVECDKFSKICSEISHFDEMYARSQHKPTLDVVKQLGTDLYDSFDETINHIYSDIGKGARSWEELAPEIEYTDKLSNEATDSLSRLMGELKLNENAAIEREFDELTPTIHNFDADEMEELDLKNLMEDNRAKLDSMAAEFRTDSGLFVDSDGWIEENHNDDYSLLDWRVLL